MKRKIFYLLLLQLLFAGHLKSQDKPFRIGVRAGAPILAGVSVEYVTRLLNGKLAVFADYTDFNQPINFETYELTPTVKYWEAGINYYIFKEGRSLYVSASYGELESSFTIDNYQYNARNDGAGASDLAVSSGFLKVGAKFGRWFYIKPEIGLMFEEMPSSLDVNLDFADGSSLVHQLEWPDPLLSIGLVASIGIGLGF